MDASELPKGVEAAAAGLSPQELADLADQAVFTAAELELLRTAGFRVLTSREAEAGLHPPWQLTVRAGAIVYREQDGTHLQVGAGVWIKHAALTRDVVVAGLEALDADQPVPFWLVLPQPMNPLGELPEEVVEAWTTLPTVAEPGQWPLADADAVETAAKAVMALNPAAMMLPCMVMRGSLAADLASRPLRSLAAWREHPLFGYLIHDELGGADMWEAAREHRTGPMATERRYNRTFHSGEGMAFWETMPLSESAWLPEPDGDGEYDRHDLAALVQTLEEEGWFNLWKLDADVDGLSLLHAPRRSVEGWRDSDFAHVLRIQ